jgi:mannosyltransferase OCH1-like enzyme
MIPKHLYTCWHTDLPPLMKQNHEWMKQQNPDIQFHLYNEKMCEDFIKTHFNKKILHAYQSLIPCSYKSDLWRYCILYIRGGIYLDIKYRCANGFKLSSFTKKTFVKDRPDGCVYTALIVVPPKNKIMLHCINQIVFNVKYNYYGKTALDPTGPGLLGNYFTKQKIDRLPLKFVSYQEINDNFAGIMNTNFILVYYDGYREEQKKYQKLKPYYILWKERKIFH